MLRHSHSSDVAKQRVRGRLRVFATQFAKCGNVNFYHLQAQN